MKTAVARSTLFALVVIALTGPVTVPRPSPAPQPRPPGRILPPP